MTTSEILEKQKKYFATGETKSIKFRKQQLKNLKKAILENEQNIYNALKTDLGKIEIESYMCEFALVINEVDFMLNHLKKFSKPQRVHTGIANFPAKSYTLFAPKGNVLIMSPWNYPFMLTMEPLVDALSAGNTAIVKPSAYSPKTTEVINNIISTTFKPEYVSCIVGGREANQDLLTLKFDHIFFTGSKAVGHEVLKSAEKHMATITLELGGKSPCIVDSKAKISLSAKRIVFGKFMNVGQTCVAPDYVLVHESVKQQLLNALVYEIKRQYGESPLLDANYGKIISEKHFNKVVSFLEGQNIYYGGKIDSKSLKIEPTIVDSPNLDSPIMTEEIFGPILPVMSYNTKEQALEIIKRNDTPLALYVFSQDKQTIDFFVNNVQFGGGCINDTIMHLTTPLLPFGGVGQSGMGAYHGKCGFDEFSHRKSIINKSTKLDVPLRYRPHSKFKKNMIKKFL